MTGKYKIHLAAKKYFPLPVKATPSLQSRRFGADVITPEPPSSGYYAETMQQEIKKYNYITSFF